MPVEDDVKHRSLSVPPSFKAWAPPSLTVFTLNIWDNFGIALTADLKNKLLHSKSTVDKKYVLVSHGHFRDGLAHDSRCTLCFGLMFFCIHLVFFLFFQLRLGFLTWQLWVRVKRAHCFPEMYTEWCADPCHFPVEMLHVFCRSLKGFCILSFNHSTNAYYGNVYYYMLGTVLNAGNTVMNYKDSSPVLMELTFSIPKRLGSPNLKLKVTCYGCSPCIPKMNNCLIALWMEIFWVIFLLLLSLK